ncbi:hypothetical protein HN51_050793 [Arachis hypogaea]
MRLLLLACGKRSIVLTRITRINRLGTMLIDNNRITRINPNIGEFLPKLHMLVLTNSRIVNLVEIDPLTSLPKLQYLSLLDNTLQRSRITSFMLFTS